MSARILLEDDQGEFIVDSKKLSEALKDNKDITLLDIPGRFSVCDVVNGNGRRYSKAVWEQQLASASTLMQLIENHSCFGLLEHPKDGTVDLSSPISHIVTKAYMAENGEVHGCIRVLNTQDGRKLAALIEAGYNPRVSSRGFGSVKHVGNVDEVENDYVCEGWDIVARPSCGNAILDVPRPSSKSESLQTRYENLDAFKKDDGIIGLSTRLGYKSTEEAWSANPILTAIGEQLRESEGEKKAPDRVVEHQGAQPEKTMTTIDQIKESLRSLSADPGKLTANQITEKLRDLDDLHHEVAQVLVANPASQWECQKVHENISSVEKELSDILDAPKIIAAKLTEENAKLYRVIKTLAETANNYKKKLSEEYARTDQYGKLVQELTRRGRGWKQRAENLATSGALSERRFVVASESLDELAAMHKSQRQRYNEDVTALGKRIIETDCAESLKDPEISQALTEAKTPSELAELRGKIEAKKSDKKGGKKKECESVPSTPAFSAAKKEVVTESVTTIRPSSTDPSTLEESVAIARRLSGRQ